jgi:hypothetical protein
VLLKLSGGVCEPNTNWYGPASRYSPDPLTQSMASRSRRVRRPVRRGHDPRRRRRSGQDGASPPAVRRLGALCPKPLRLWLAGQPERAHRTRGLGHAAQTPSRARPDRAVRPRRGRGTRRFGIRAAARAGVPRLAATLSDSPISSGREQNMPWRWVSLPGSRQAEPARPRPGRSQGRCETPPADGQARPGDGSGGQ